MSEPWTLTARWIFPVDRGPLEGGAITIRDDKIVAVEPHASGRVSVDLGEMAVIPGLVNAHTHLDLSGARGLIPPTPNFTAWLRGVIEYRRRLSVEETAAAIHAGLAECLAAGTTLIGDISGDGASWEPLANTSSRAIVFRELLGLSKDRALRAWAETERWLRAHGATATCRPGISPHAPYSARFSLFLAAATTGVPVATHLAESGDELSLLHDQRGPFVPFLRELGAWEPDGLVANVENVLQLCNRPSPALFVHGNFLKPGAPIPANGSVVYCPRTHAAFGNPPHPFKDLLARGVRVALGTDSLASNPDLSVLEEARFLHRQFPEISGTALLRMATLSGAEALGWNEEVGSLCAGKSADLVVVPLSADVRKDPHERLFATGAPVERVLFRGRWSYERAVNGPAASQS